jgi:hypothetical protein
LALLTKAIAANSKTAIDIFFNFPGLNKGGCLDAIIAGIIMQPEKIWI